MKRERERAWEGQSDSSLILMCVKMTASLQAESLPVRGSEWNLQCGESRDQQRRTALRIISPCLLKTQCAQSRSFFWSRVCVRARVDSVNENTTHMLFLSYPQKSKHSQPCECLTVSGKGCFCVSCKPNGYRMWLKFFPKHLILHYVVSCAWINMHMCA